MKKVFCFIFLIFFVFSLCYQSVYCEDNANLTGDATNLIKWAEEGKFLYIVLFFVSMPIFLFLINYKNTKNVKYSFYLSLFVLYFFVLLFFAINFFTMKVLI